MPDISKWNTNNIINMDFMFARCKSLLSLPDISKWNTNNLKNIYQVFAESENLVLSKKILKKFQDKNYSDDENSNSSSHSSEKEKKIF